MNVQIRRLLNTFYLEIRNDLFKLRRKNFFLHEIIDYLIKNKNKYGYKKLFGFFCISDIVLQEEKQVILNEIRLKDECLANELELIWVLSAMNMVDGCLFNVDSIFYGNKTINYLDSFEDNASKKARSACEFLNRYDREFLIVAREVFNEFEGLGYKAFSYVVLNNLLTNVEIRNVLDIKIFFKDNFENIQTKEKRFYLSWENAAFFVKHLELNVGNKLNEDLLFSIYEKFILENKRVNFVKYVKEVMLGVVE